ncbi:MAG: hypothetical protein JWP74_417 [Marmoricola sp.]|nr:hypothetical protein [Aeromicrobium sp.]MCW2783900.1 hypothetical protein [Marmoricola sp.]
MGLSLLPIILIVVGAWLAGWGLKRRRALGGLPGGWRRVAGTVIDTGDGSARPPRIEYRTPDGRRLRIEGPPATPFSVGDEVAVLLDPADPTRARLDLTEREAARLVTLLIATGGIVLVIGAVAAVALL